ncbi:MupG family TIM beta-alpha barrel fold protein [Companilactobacillus insicii]|uniref:MupG family TIM beta-alpha barrel fold protein n=1 Tax=Companilactobacillus insicii TaxID=1732567 RepID=UPI000F79BF35|nr:MupG family TIM beta-alpha barrel fold protein [Companilactobacillus insicii]
MLGFSVYLNKVLEKEEFNQIEKYAKAGFKGVFTSINLPEDDPKNLLHNLAELGQVCEANNLHLTLDISSESMKRLNLSLDPEGFESLTDLHVDMLRIDDGITNQQIAEVSKKLKLALNASTIVESDVDELIQYGADFDNLEAWHNYYPRVNTGLSNDWFYQKNQWLKQKGFTVMAFIPGDTNLRGPVHAGLPTLEDDRYNNPLSSAINMSRFDVDKVFLGDPVIKDETLHQFEEYYQNNVILLHANILKNAPSYITKVMHQRADVARDVVRLREGRPWNTVMIPPKNTVKRERGAITLDNSISGRYQGELQLLKRDLPVDKTVNVIGQISDDDIDLLDNCGANQAIKICETEDGVS